MILDLPLATLWNIKKLNITTNSTSDMCLNQSLNNVFWVVNFRVYKNTSSSNAPPPGRYRPLYSDDVTRGVVMASLGPRLLLLFNLQSQGFLSGYIDVSGVKNRSILFQQWFSDNILLLNQLFNMINSIELRQTSKPVTLK